MLYSRHWTPFICMIFSIIFLAGCGQNIDFRQKRLANAQLHISQIRNRTIPDDTVHTLHWCIEKALSQNLDLKADELRQAVLRERKTAAVLGMLPDLNLNYRMGSRDNEPGARSESITTGIETLEPSKSSEKDESRYHFELMFSVLDFGLSYYNAIHETDKALLEEKQMRRTAQNLMLDVAKAYFRVASIQYEMGTIKDLIDRSEAAETLIDDLRTKKRIGPLEALDKVKALKKLKQRLRVYRRSYENACIQLTSLMGFAPVNEIRVDTSFLEEINVVETPPIEALEQAALDERPELYQLDIESHITAIEARKSMLMMFPNVRLFANFTDSSNRYLYNQSWYEVALDAVYNLLKLPSELYNSNALDIQLRELNTQTMALSIGIMAQVRIAHANLMEVKSRYELAEELFTIDQQRLEAARPRARSGGSLSSLDLLKYELETAESFFERTQSLSNYYLAYYRLLNAVGVESLDDGAVRRAQGMLPGIQTAPFVGVDAQTNRQTTAFNFMMDTIGRDSFSQDGTPSPTRSEDYTNDNIQTLPAATYDDQTLGSPNLGSASSRPTSAFSFMLDNIQASNSEKKDASPDAENAQVYPTREIVEDTIDADNGMAVEKPVDANDVNMSDQDAGSPKTQSSQTNPAFRLMLDQITRDM